MKERPCSSTSYQLNRCFVNVFGKKLRTGFCPAPRPGAFAIGVQSILSSRVGVDATKDNRPVRKIIRSSRRRVFIFRAFIGEKMWMVAFTPTRRRQSEIVHR